MKRFLLLLLAVFTAVMVQAQGQNALDFDGIDDEISVPGASALIANSGEISISTATANAAGRRGAKDADLYLGSPATVAASAVAGEITDPRSVL